MRGKYHFRSREGQNGDDNKKGRGRSKSQERQRKGNITVVRN